MKGLVEVSKKTKGLRPLPGLEIYYSFKTDTVSVTNGADKYFVGTLIRESTPKEIKDFVNYWKTL